MHQIQLTYVPGEDRILFRVNTTAQEEFRFWMTRRYLALLWQTLSRLVSEIAAAQSGGAQTLAAAGARHPAPVDPLSLAAGVEMKHQAAVASADFSTAYQEGPILPLGPEPALLHRVALKPNESGQATLCLHPEIGAGIELVLNDRILHSLCQLMADTSTKAGWGLDLRFVAPPQETDQGQPPTGLN